MFLQKKNAKRIDLGKRSKAPLLSHRHLSTTETVKNQQTRENTSMQQPQTAPCDVFMSVDVWHIWSSRYAKDEIKKKPHKTAPHNKQQNTRKLQKCSLELRYTTDRQIYKSHHQQWNWAKRV